MSEGRKLHAVEPVTPAQRQHRATYANDKRNGGYIVRVEGPHASKFAKRIIPVTRKDNSESMEELEMLIWSGVDQENGKPVSLYKFKRKAPEVSEATF